MSTQSSGFEQSVSLKYKGQEYAVYCDIDIPGTARVGPCIICGAMDCPDKGVTVKNIVDEDYRDVSLSNPEAVEIVEIVKTLLGDGMSVCSKNSCHDALARRQHEIVTAAGDVETLLVLLGEFEESE